MRYIIIAMLLFCACQKQAPQNLSLKFLDEYILPDSLMVDGTLVGGLSGIDYQNNTYYIACDDAGDPRFYTAKISLADSIISDVSIDKVVRIKDTTAYYDLESILFESGKILLTSEGLISAKEIRRFLPSTLKGMH